MEQKRGVICIRHAQSTFNIAEAKAKQDNNFDKIEFRYLKEYIDCPLSELGKKQAEEAREKLKQENIKIILASPLSRCLMTAKIMFEGHPSNPKVIVVPELREKIHSACDIPDNIELLMKEFPEFDFSLFEKFSRKKLWFLELINDDTLREELLAEIKEKNIEDDLEAVKDIIIRRLQENHPVGMESELDLHERVIKSKEIVRKYLEQVKEGERVALISHFLYLRSLTAKYFQDGAPVMGMRFQNCVPVEIEF